MPEKVHLNSLSITAGVKQDMISPRQWLIPPEYMCEEDIRKEHAWIHQFEEIIRNGYSLDSEYANRVFFGAGYLEYRHTLLSPRISGHGSDLIITENDKFNYPLVTPTMDDVRNSTKVLHESCKSCRTLF